MQEAGTLLNNDTLQQAAKELTDAGDEWRRFALRATKMVRGREEMSLKSLSDTLNLVADREAAVWQRLRNFAID